MPDRKLCTEETPSDGTPYEWFHPDARVIESRDYSDGESYDMYLCPHCGITFQVTIAQ